MIWEIFSKYDNLAIFEMSGKKQDAVSCIQKKLRRMEVKKIYLDMDGLLADIDKGVCGNCVG